MDTEEMIRANLHLIPGVARKFGDIANDPDVRQCGMIGLWKAVEKWDGKRNFKTWAKVCIRHAITDHLRKVKRWEPTAEILETGAEDERDLIGAIKQAFPRGSMEREILLGLLRGQPKQVLAEKFGISRKAVTRIAAEAWRKMEE